MMEASGDARWDDEADAIIVGLGGAGVCGRLAGATAATAPGREAGPEEQ